MKKRKTILKFAGIIVGLITLLSCEKDMATSGSTGTAKVNVILHGSEVDDKSSDNETSPNTRASTQRQQSVGQQIQSVIVPFSDDLLIEASLIPEALLSEAEDSSVSLQADNKRNSKAAIVRNPLPTNIRYKLVIYDNDGKFVSEANYPTADALMLDAGKRYTFVAYSVGSTTDLPELSSTADLQDAVLANVDGKADFMMAIVEKELVAGSNDLNLVLKHKFTQITTVIDGSALGNIQTISSPRFTPHYANADIRMADGNINYKSLTANTVGSAVTFPSGTAPSRTSTATIIATPQTNTGALRISSLTIGNQTRSNIVFNNLVITPGQRYTLRIKVKNPFELTPGLIWAPGNLIGNVNYTYAFAQPQGTGSYFPFGKLLAYNQAPYNNNPDGDPCQYVTTDGGGWRTPTSQEFLQLQSKRYVFTNRNGVAGALYDNTVFMPAASYMYWSYYEQTYYLYDPVGRSGYYWASDNLYHGFFTNQQNYTSTATWNYPQYLEAAKSALQIRCVKPIN